MKLFSLLCPGMHLSTFFLTSKNETLMIVIIIIYCYNYYVLLLLLYIVIIIVIIITVLSKFGINKDRYLTTNEWFYWLTFHIRIPYSK